MKNSTGILGILCISFATGLSLYWIMFLSTNLPRMARFGLDTPGMYASTGIIGSICVALFAIGIVSLRRKVSRTLVLVRNAEGKVVSIREAELGRLTIGKAGARAEAEAPGAQPSSRQEIRHKPDSKLQSKANKHRTGGIMGIAVLAALILCAYASSMALTGYDIQDMAGGIFSPFMAVSSSSMSPTLNYGDLVIVRKEAPERIEVGEIIAFNVPIPYDRAAPSPTIHRVAWKENENGQTYFKTKGDGNQGEDPWKVSGKELIGKCFLRIPYVGLFILYLRSPIGLALIVIVLAARFIYSFASKKR